MLGNGDTTGGDGDALVVSSFTARTANGTSGPERRRQLHLHAECQLQRSGQLHLHHHGCQWRHFDRHGSDRRDTGEQPADAVDDSYTTAEDTALTMTAPGVLGKATRPTATVVPGREQLYAARPTAVWP